MSFQSVIATDEEWDIEVQQTAGYLQVIDVHQDWCGPCKAIQSTFKRIYFDYGDRPLKFYTANAEKITAMAEYKGQALPLTLFYKDGAMIKKVEGVDAPELTDVIMSNLPEAAA